MKTSLTLPALPALPALALLLLALPAFAAFTCDPEGAFRLTYNNTPLEFAPPELLHLNEERPAPDNWSPTWSALEAWPGKTWSLFPRYDDDGSIILGGAFRQLVPGSVSITPLDRTTPFVEGRDFLVNPEWGFVANLLNRLGTPGETKLRFSATLALQRIDLIQTLPDGTLSVKRGTSRRISPRLPDPDPGATPLAGVYIAPWQRNGAYRLLAEDVYPIDPAQSPPVPPIRPEAVTRTLAKLQSGSPVSIAFIGDSITLGAEAGPWWKDDSTTWRGRTLRTLRDRFPASTLTEIQAFQGGRGITFGLSVLPETVLPAKPDLAFVMLGINDCHRGLHSPEPGTPIQDFAPAFDALLTRLLEANIEVIVLTSMETNPFDANGDAARWLAYREVIRQASIRHQTAYGDTYEEWQRLRHRGIPPFSQLHNWINHPGSFGHALIADVALRFFPAP